jgi:hypothetical protein
LAAAQWGLSKVKPLVTPSDIEEGAQWVVCESRTVENPFALLSYMA